MTTLTPTRTAPSSPPGRWLLRDVLTVTGRNLTKLRRTPQLVLFSTVQPVMFVLLFAFVFGGAIDIPGVNYVDFLLPGVFVQSAMFGSTQTGIALNDDLQHGIVDRFRSLPMARSAVLAGRTLADMVRTAFIVVLMTGVGYAIGFRFRAGLLAALGAIVIAILTGFAFSWVSANIGLRAGDAETAQAAGFIWVFPLVFASSAFVPTQTMPSWLQAFAEATPVTASVNAMRLLVLGADAPPIQAVGASPTTMVASALLWIAGILVVFVPLAVRRYRRIA